MNAPPNEIIINMKWGGGHFFGARAVSYQVCIRLTRRQPDIYFGVFRGPGKRGEAKRCFFIIMIGARSWEKSFVCCFPNQNSDSGLKLGKLETSELAIRY